MSNQELELAFKYAQYTHRNIFLTGKAGTGKTTFLRHLQQVTQKRMIIVAPTGVAAINAGGVTIHSFFQLAPGMYLPGQKIGGRDQQLKYSFSKQKVNILRTLDLLVIDEISMVRCDLLDAIDEVLRRYQNRYLPFGGVQLLMIGDLQQLAPVAKDNEWEILRQHGYESPYFFGSQALRKTNYTAIELKQVYRQADPTFVNLLNEVRDNRLSPASLATLNSRVKPHFRPTENERYITLTTHNYQAQDINQMQMTLLPTPSMKYKASISGEFPDSSYPTDAELTLKIGAQVMFCKNDSNHRYYNGKIGRVVKCDNERVWVECEPDSLDPSYDENENKPIEVTPQEWTNSKYATNQKTGEITEEIVGKFTQIPLKTAWAITVHKSQGLTFDRAIIQADKAFSAGQVYVALSRCRSLGGLVLNTPIPANAITVDSTVVQYNKFIEQIKPTTTELMQDRKLCIEEILCRIFDFTSLIMRLNYICSLSDQYLYKLYPNFVRNLKAIRDEVDGKNEEQKKVSLVYVGKSFQQVIKQQMPLSENFDDNETLKNRLTKGFTWFLNRTSELLQDVIDNGLPEIDNNSVKEQMQKEFDLLTNDYDMKIQIFTSCISGFSLDTYWKAKAIASMNVDTKKKSPKLNKRPNKKSVDNETLARAEAAASSDILNPKLYEAIRAWRIKKASERKVPPYVVLHNSTLLAIANMKPKTSEEFLAINGFSKRKLDDFGKELLEIIEKT